jgi:RNA polymerase sigma factor (sigma-70 family)
MSPDQAFRRRGGEPYIGHVLSTRNSTVVVGHEREEMESDDSVLWSRSLAGDADAFTALFERHAKAIYNYCFRRLGDWGAAEDMLSLVFLEAWRRRDQELPQGKVLPWLYGIATNVVRNRRRSERRSELRLMRLQGDPLEPDFEDQVDDRLDDERRIRRALELLGQLPRREQDVFVLCAWSELGSTTPRSRSTSRSEPFAQAQHLRAEIVEQRRPRAVFQRPALRVGVALALRSAQSFLRHLRSVCAASSSTCLVAASLRPRPS